MSNDFITRDTIGSDNPPPISRDGDGGEPNRDGPNLPNYHERLRRCRLGLAVGLAPVVMLFVAFTSAYIIRQSMGEWDPATGTYVSDWSPVRLPLLLMGVNTLILAFSSLSMEFARRQMMRESLLAPLASIPGVAAEDKNRFPWLALTAVLGVAFLVGQYLVWQEMGNRGFYLASGPSSQFVYILTGAHAVHLFGGVIALLVAVWAIIRHRPVAGRAITVDIAAWYWHFMGVLWIYIFALLWFLK